MAELNIACNLNFDDHFKIHYLYCVNHFPERKLSSESVAMVDDWLSWLKVCDIQH